MRGVVAVLVVQQVVLVRDPRQLPAVRRPAVQRARSPAHAVDVPGDPVADDAADVVAHPERLPHAVGRRVEPVDDRRAVRPVLGDRNPDGAPVEVDAAGVVGVALAEDDVLEQPAAAVQHEHVAAALARAAVVAVDRLRVAHRRLDDLDGGHEDLVTDEGEALRVVGGEVEGDPRRRSPRRAARRRRERRDHRGVAPAGRAGAVAIAVGEGGRRRGRQDGCQSGSEDGAEDSLHRGAPIQALPGWPGRRARWPAGRRRGPGRSRGAGSGWCPRRSA